ncbi:MAG: TerB family tellurite resistance protein [Alphaproteobacteria bacterium]|nr:TerB family tellurite resistance protein [Alphaproteobacteria bacterium SS10]
MAKYSYLVNRVRQHALRDARVGEFEDTQMASAILLVNAAKMDGRMSEAERQAVLGNLRIKFGLQKDGAEQLMGAAEKKTEDHVNLYDVADTLEEGMSLRQRQELMAMMRDVVLSDGHLDPLEQALLAQMGNMLNVPKGNPALARQRVAAALGITRMAQDHQKDVEAEKELEEEQRLAAQQEQKNQRNMGNTLNA